MKMNAFIGFGIAATEPTILRSESGDVFGSCRLCCINNPKRSRGKRGESKDFDFVLFKTRDPKIAEQMAATHKADFVCVYGVCTTDFIKRSYVCDKCGEKFSFDGVQTYITPIMWNVIYPGYALDNEGNFSNDKANYILSQYKEVSNRLFLAGMLTKDPIGYRVNEVGVAKCSAFQMASMRKYRLIGESDPERRVDFPWIKVWGSNSKHIQAWAQKGTILQMDGFVRARPFKKRVTCPCCGAEVVKSSISGDIAVYEPEFVSGTKDVDVDQVKIQRTFIENEDINELTINHISAEEEAFAEETFQKEKDKYTLPGDDKKDAPKPQDDNKDSDAEPISLEKLKKWQ